MDDRRQRVRFFDYLLDRQMPVAGSLAIAAAAALAAVDWTTWVELHVSAVYGVPLVLAAVARNRRLLWALAAGLLAMTFAAYAHQIPSGAFSLHEPYFLNRVLSAAALIISAALCHVWIVAANRLAAQGRSLEAANSRKTQLLASISHDIRSPLATMQLISELLARSSGTPAQIPELVQRMRSNITSLDDLVSALVDISALDAGRISLNVSEFPLNELLASERRRLLPLAHAKGLSLELDLPGAEMRLRTDRLKLIRVLSNLVGNAIKFTGKGGITVSAAPGPGGAPIVRVRDTGPGMSAESLQRIFDEYGQLGNPEHDKNKGWGLGLAICRRLAGAMGGTITVESEPGRGTAFSVHLPASSVVHR